MTTSRYAALCSEYEAQHDDHVSWKRNAQTFATTFREQFESYLGASEGSVRLCGITMENGVPIQTEKRGTKAGEEYLALDNNNNWLFAVEVDFFAPTTGGHIVPCCCSFGLYGPAVAMRIADQATTIQIRHIAEPETYAEACEALYTHYEAYFKWRPHKGPRPSMTLSRGEWSYSVPGIRA